MAEYRAGASAEHAFADHEHLDLAPGIERLHEVARAVGAIAPADWLGSVLGVIDWVETTVQPHTAWEDAWLYPDIARRAGSPWATKLMTFEHQQILDIARKLDVDREFLRDVPDRDEMIELRGRLFALEALLRAHIEREERFLLPLLETGTDDASGARSQ